MLDRRVHLRSPRSPQSWRQGSGGWVSRRISSALERQSSARKETTWFLSPPGVGVVNGVLVAVATAFQVSPATERLLPPPPEAVTAVRGRDRRHQLFSWPPEGKGKVRNSSGSSWHSGHQCLHQGLGREQGLRECQGRWRESGREVVMLKSGTGIQDT